MSKLIRFRWVFMLLLVAIASCNPIEKKQEKAEMKRLKRFFDKFHPLELPYKMITDPNSTASNHAVFTDLLTENHELDTSEVSHFELNMTTEQVDSLSEQTNIGVQFKFYAIGQIYEKAQRKVILYGRTDVETEENFTIFIATYDEKGKKLDEKIFHRPLYLLPPREIQRTSEVRSDSTFILTQIKGEHKLVDEKDEYMELIRQTAHERIYTLNKAGNMTLTSENNRELTPEEIEATRMIDSLNQNRRITISDSVQNTENQE